MKTISYFLNFINIVIFRKEDLKLLYLILKINKIKLNNYKKRMENLQATKLIT